MTTNIENIDIEPFTLESMKELFNSIEFIRSFFNDQVIHDVSQILIPILKAVNALASTDLIDILEQALQDPKVDKALINPPRVGMWGALGSMRNKDMQRGLGVVIEIIKALGRAAADNTE